MAGHDRQTPSVNCCLAPIETWRLNPRKSQIIENSQKQTNKSISMIADQSEKKYAKYLRTEVRGDFNIHGTKYF